MGRMSTPFRASRTPSNRGASAPHPMASPLLYMHAYAHTLPVSTRIRSTTSAANERNGTDVGFIQSQQDPLEPRGIGFPPHGIPVA